MSLNLAFVCVFLGQVERQAVNTTIQGSAADIVKIAMVKIDELLEKTFKEMSDTKPKLVLHLHDELLYETPTKYITLVAQILKNCMESSHKLSVPLSVKLKVGRSWGSMEEI